MKRHHKHHFFSLLFNFHCSTQGLFVNKFCLLPALFSYISAKVFMYMYVYSQFVSLAYFERSTICIAFYVVVL